MSRVRSVIIGCVLCVILSASGRAEVAETYASLDEALNETALDIAGDRYEPLSWDRASAAWHSMREELSDAEALTFFARSTPSAAPANASQAAELLGSWRAAAQHLAALEMLGAFRAGDRERARTWRAVIALPRHASAVDGTLALQRIGGGAAQQEEVAKLLVREYLLWQVTRVRERSDELLEFTRNKAFHRTLAQARAGEIAGLAKFPASLRARSRVAPAPDFSNGEPAQFIERAKAWKTALESGLPDLLTAADAERNERLVLKFLRLIPKEYHNGVRDGQIVVPLEYREAQTFTTEARQLLAELLPNWQRTKRQAVAEHYAALETGWDALAGSIKSRDDDKKIEAQTKELMSVLESKFGLVLRKQGKGSEVVAETVLEVRSLLGQSLAAAQGQRWRDSDALRLEAYTTFDLELETRVLPRDPSLGRDVERRFLDGNPGAPGIKAALDARLHGEPLSAAYERALEGLAECEALLKVGISPATVTFTAFTIGLREGLEAVVIFAALLAGFRGPEHAKTRRRLAGGAWGAVGVSILTFLLAQTVVQSLSHYGEKLEAVVSILAVCVLLMVTNWVFHKVYWVQWNSRLRTLSKQAERGASTRWEGLAMLGVGFLTVYREGFETTLFLQSLILEGGWVPALTGLALAALVIGAIGTCIFLLGAKLPYRKLLIVTGVLVVSILVTFVGSTVRLFQTVGWMPIHPITWLKIPSWMGLWLGLYPSWEGILIPFAGLAYVAGAWLWVKVRSRSTGVPVPSHKKPGAMLVA